MLDSTVPEYPDEDVARTTKASALTESSDTAVDPSPRMLKWSINNSLEFDFENAYISVKQKKNYEISKH
jgi:hypothetical protein